MPLLSGLSKFTGLQEKIMNIVVQANGIAPGKDVTHFVRCRAELALYPLGEQIRLVSVFVDQAENDADGDRIRCLVLVRPGVHPDIEVETTSNNLYVAIHRAVDEAAWTLAGSLTRQQGSLVSRQVGIIDGWNARQGKHTGLEPNQAA